MEILDRFFNYVKIYTTSDEESGTHPSSARQFDLARVLEGELKDFLCMALAEEMQIRQKTSRRIIEEFLIYVNSSRRSIPQLGKDLLF